MVKGRNYTANCFLFYIRLLRRFKIDGELSIISHPFSYGGKEDKFEIMEVGNAEIEVVIGYLTAEEVIRYIENWNK